MSKILIISSPFSGSNSGALCREFARGSVEAIKGFVACCKKSEIRRFIAVPGLENAGAIAGNPALNEAFEAGKKL